MTYYCLIGAGEVTYYTDAVGGWIVVGAARGLESFAFLASLLFFFAFSSESSESTDDSSDEDSFSGFFEVLGLDYAVFEDCYSP